MHRIEYIKQIMLEHMQQIANNEEFTYDISEFIADIKTTIIQKSVSDWYEHYENILKEYDAYVLGGRSNMQYDYLIKNKMALINQINKYETAKDLKNSPKYNVYCNIDEIIIGYLTNEDLKFHYFEFVKRPGNVENKPLFLLEQEIDKRNPNVHPDMRQFDFDTILSKEPFTVNQSEEKLAVEFEIIKANINRKARGTEWIRVKVYVNNEIDDVLWMNESDIEKNKKEFGKFRNSLQDFLDKD